MTVTITKWKQKDLQTTFILNGDQQTNQMKNVLDFVFKNYGNTVNLRKTISRAAEYREDPYGNITNLSKHSFTKE